METFRTIVTPSGAPLQRRPSDVFLAIGSCFAERIGQLMIQSRLDALVNANGILYNPFSMSTAICRLLDNNAWTRDDLIDFVLAKILHRLGVDSALRKPWETPDDLYEDAT